MTKSLPPEVEHVAYRIREALHKFDIVKHHNYAVYMAKVAMNAVDETKNGTLLLPEPEIDELDALLS